MDENHIATFDSDLSVENQSLESTNNNQQSIIESASFTPIIVEPIDELQIEIDNSYKSLIDNIVNARQVCNKLKERKVNYQKTIETQKAIVDELKKIISCHMKPRKMSLLTTKLLYIKKASSMNIAPKYLNMLTR